MQLNMCKTYRIGTFSLIFLIALFPLFFWGEYIQQSLSIGCLKGWWHFLSVNVGCEAINNEGKQFNNKEFTFPPNILPYSRQIFDCNIHRATPYLPSYLKTKIMTTKYTSTIQVLTSLIDKCKTSHILNTTEQLLILKHVIQLGKHYRLP